MENKVTYYKDLLQETMRRVLSSSSEWTKFLTPAARFYKYSFAEQLMIYAQQPNASACAEPWIWQMLFRRQFRTGAKSIALLTDNDDIALRYVFDIGETRPTPESKAVYIWQLQRRHYNAVAEMLERNYRVPAGEELREQLLRVADVATQEYRSTGYGSYSLFDIGAKGKRKSADRRRQTCFGKTICAGNSIIAKKRSTGGTQCNAGHGQCAAGSRCTGNNRRGGQKSGI